MVRDIFRIKKGSLQNRFGNKSGFALFVAVGVASILLLITIAMSNVTLKQVLISQSAKESQKAFYAADNGIECVLFWEIINPTNPGESAFDSTGQTISCGIQEFSVGGGNTSEFTVLFDTTDPADDPLSPCSVITVDKTGGTTVIESRGRNLCTGNSNRRVERGVRVKY